MIGLIGGSGLRQLDGLLVEQTLRQHTPYGEPSAALRIGTFAGREIVFLPRHGEQHTIAPHLINYRANLWALHQLGVKQLISIASVGGISEGYSPGLLALPDQIIDYSWGRETSFASEQFSADKHIDFTYPFDDKLRQQLQLAANKEDIPLLAAGTYAVTQGPRLETAAEIQRLKHDGADMVGMTAMPEAALARELNIAYATVAVIANYAAGLTPGVLTMQAMVATMETAMQQVHRVLAATIPLL